MSNNFGDLTDLLSLFEDSISTTDIISSDCLANISSAIVKKRIELNLSQKEFAEKLNISQSMVSKWESSDYNFTIKTLAEIAVKLNMQLHVELSDYTSDNEQYTNATTYSCISSKPAEFKNQKIISLFQYKSNKHITKTKPKEM